MLEFFELAKQAFIAYVGNGYQVYLLGIVLVLMLVYGLKDKDKVNKFFLIYLLLFLFIFFCPVTAKIIMKYCVGKSVYWRMMWILPTTILLAYYFTKAATEWKNTISKIALTLVVLVLMTNSGANILDSLTYDAALDVSKVAGPVGEICQFMEEDAASRGDEEIYAIFPNEHVPYVRQVDANIHIPYGRDVLRYYDWHEVYNILVIRPLDVAAITEYIVEYNYDYFVYNVYGDPLVETALYEYGFQKVAEFSNYSVFYCP